jgi:hypothetical protein
MRPPKTILKTLKVRENIINKTSEDLQPQIRTSLSDINNKQKKQYTQFVHVYLEIVKMLVEKTVM